MNFFQPTMKLVTKTRHGAKVSKVYDTARTPYQRLLEAGMLTDAKQQELAATYHHQNGHYCTPANYLLVKEVDSIYNMRQVHPRWLIKLKPGGKINLRHDNEL